MSNTVGAAPFGLEVTILILWKRLNRCRDSNDPFWPNRFGQIDVGHDPFWQNRFPNGAGGLLDNWAARPLCAIHPAGPRRFRPCILLSLLADWCRDRNDQFWPNRFGNIDVGHDPFWPNRFPTCCVLPSQSFSCGDNAWKWRRAHIFSSKLPRSQAEVKLTHLPSQTVSFPSELIEYSATHCYLHTDTLATCLVQAPQAAMVEGVITQGPATSAVANFCDSNFQYQPVRCHRIHFWVSERSHQRLQLGTVPKFAATVCLKSQDVISKVVDDDNFTWCGLDKALISIHLHNQLTFKST